MRANASSWQQSCCPAEGAAREEAPAAAARAAVLIGLAIAIIGCARAHADLTAQLAVKQRVRLHTCTPRHSTS